METPDVAMVTPDYTLSIIDLLFSSVFPVSCTGDFDNCDNEVNDDNTEG